LRPERPIGTAERAMIELILAQSEDQLPAIRKLFAEYANSLGCELCFQSFQEELDGLRLAIGEAHRR
jgi:hypothetical protein